MAQDWAADVKRYDPNADDGIIAGIVRYCGIALQKRDSSLVSMGDATETGRVRENFLKKKLALTDSDETLDAAIAAIGTVMKGDNFKNRVTVYYLLAQHFGKLGLFDKNGGAKASSANAAGGAVAAGAAGATAMGLASLGGKDGGGNGGDADKPDEPADSAVPPPVSPPARAAAPASAPTPTPADDGTGAGTAAATVAGVAAAAGAASAGAMSATGSTTPPTQPAMAMSSPAEPPQDTAPPGATSRASFDDFGDSEQSGGMGWLLWLLLGVLALTLIWWFLIRTPTDGERAGAQATASPTTTATDMATAGTAPDTAAAGGMAAVDLTTAPAEGTVAIPDGAGVTSELRDGKPVVKVYFDTSSTAVVPAFAGAAGGLNAWLAANPGSSLAVSGFNDATGNAAANAELSKNRAQAVQAALIAAGVAETSIELMKPEDATQGTGNDADARRVEVVVR